MQSTILLLESQPEIRGRVMGAQGTVNGLGHLIGGSEIGAIASAGATDFVASFFRCLANRMQGGPHNVVSAEYGG